eukprot:TRINITY_DN9509_c0_g1_i2.p1 TRINITY_DN9509_c0_g1~~TRINITY_DN9509_c0_g1_i2.p1  ORF type:complete len:431 (-),score=163.12 TRINITY_DN9509_c0_g1_i2:222-1514(-)
MPSSIAEVGLQTQAEAEQAIQDAGAAHIAEQLAQATEGMLSTSNNGSPSSPFASSQPGVSITLEFERSAIQVIGEPAQQVRLKQLSECLPCFTSTTLCPQELTCKVGVDQSVAEFLQALQHMIPEVKVAVDDKELLLEDQAQVPRFDALVIGPEITFEVLMMAHPLLRLQLYESDDTSLPINVGGGGAVFTGDILFVAGLGALFEGTCEDWLGSMSRLKELPKETELFCGHEYTEFFIPFAGWLEPYNKQVANRLDTIIQRRFGVPWPLTTVPSSIGTEMNTNPFLRCTDPELMKRVGMFIDLEGKFEEKAVLQKLLELLKSSVDMWQFSVPSSSQVAHLQGIEAANAKHKAQLLKEIGEWQTPTLDQIASCTDCANPHHEDEDEESNPVTIEMDSLGEAPAAAAEGEAIEVEEVRVEVSMEPGVKSTQE